MFHEKMDGFNWVVPRLARGRQDEFTKGETGFWFSFFTSFIGNKSDLMEKLQKQCKEFLSVLHPDSPDFL